MLDIVRKKSFVLSVIFAIAVFLRLGVFLLLPGHEGPDAPEPFI